MVEPAPVGISVKGQEVIKVVQSSQAEKAGVKVGWVVTTINGRPTKGTKGITEALAAGKKGGKKYKIAFTAPVGDVQPPANAEPTHLDATTVAEVEAERLEEERLEAECLEQGNGTIVLKYSTYTEEFLIRDGGILTAEVDARFCLTFVMPGCSIHISTMDVSARSEQRFCYLPETPDVKGVIEVDDEENFGQKLQQEVTSTRIHGLAKDCTYHVHVMQDAEQEAKDQEETRKRYEAAQAARAADDRNPDRSEGNRGGVAESCSCIEGAPCVDEYGCRDWKNRFDIAKANGWKGF